MITQTRLYLLTLRESLLALSLPPWPALPAFLRAVRAVLCCVFLVMGPGETLRAAGDDLRAARDTAVLLARDGHLDEAVRQLEQLLQAHPGAVGVRADLVVVLQWAGRSTEAVEVTAGLDPDRLADFELLAWVRALRAEGRVDDALALLKPRLGDAGRSADAHALYTLLLSDVGRNIQAAAYIEPWIARAPGSAEIA